MNTFNKYADYYDSIYQDKNYKKESDFLIAAIKKYSSIKVKNILSLGCGTASHDIILAKEGFKIFGIDRSKKMIEIAKDKAKKENIDIKFRVADITNFKVVEKFEFAMAMFNILGYMADNESMEKLLKNVSKSLKNNGLFVFDCWYGPAVLKSRPENKEKEIGQDLVRKTFQKLDIEKSMIGIDFEILEHNISKSKESHKIRFWYLRELEYFFEKSNFKLIKTCNFMDLNSKISEDNWNIFVIVQKL